VTELTVDLTNDGDRSVLSLTGELDIDSVAELSRRAQDVLAGDSCRELLIDLAGLTFIDSSGLGLLIELRRLALGKDVTFRIVNAQPGPARVIGIAGLTEIFGLPSSDGGPAGS
jgi:anti-sigma B factor antagonist